MSHQEFTIFFTGTISETGNQKMKSKHGTNIIFEQISIDGGFVVMVMVVVPLSWRRHRRFGSHWISAE
jgi:hypothetical protein